MTAILTNPVERRRFLRFSFVGVIGAVVDFGVANLLIYIGVELVAAGTISFICAVISNFFWNRYWTYPDSRSKSMFKQFAMFMTINAMGLVIRVPILRFLEPVLQQVFQDLPFQIPVFSPDFLAKNVTLAIAVIIVMFWNFFANRYVTYNDVSST